MKAATRPGKRYTPHQGVIEREHQNIKIRVVFDASAVSSSGKSLDDSLRVGPKLQADTADALHRCRFYVDICSPLTLAKRTGKLEYTLTIANTDTYCLA